MTLFDQVASFTALRRAALRAARGHRRRADVAAVLVDLEREVLAIERRLRDGSWAPAPLTTFPIRDPKPRIIAAAPFRDCIVHHAICAAIEPWLESAADPDSYACRIGKGNHAAVRRVRALAARSPWYLKIDVRHYFEHVPHGLLLDDLARLLPDRSVHPLIAAVLAGGATAPGLGLPIGALTSQHLANLYLGHLDHFARDQLRVDGWVRYMDDMVAFGADKATVRGWAGALGEEARRHGLVLKDEVTVVAPVHIGVPMLGFRVWPGLARLAAARARRFRRRMRVAQSHAAAGNEGGAARSAQSLVAWVAAGDSLAFRRSFFASRNGNRARMALGSEDEPAPTA